MDQVSISSAYVWAIVVTVVFFLFAVVIANLILYKPKNPGTTARRVWFWVLCAASGVVGFVINYIISLGIRVPSIQSSYVEHSVYAFGICIVAYILIGLIISKLAPNSKVGTWF